MLILAFRSLSSDSGLVASVVLFSASDEFSVVCDVISSSLVSSKSLVKRLCVEVDNAILAAMLVGNVSVKLSEQFLSIYDSIDVLPIFY